MRATLPSMLAVIGVVALTACRRAPRQEGIASTAESTATSASSPPPPPAAAPGEEIGLFLESYTPGNSTGIAFYWPNERWRPCRQLARKSSPPQVGFVEMSLRLDENGNVTAAAVLGSDGLDDAVVACVTDAGRTSKFSEPDGGSGSIYAYVALR